jgi:hypothetical protein
VAGPFDPTLKALVESAPEDWPVLAGQPRAPTKVIDVDIATVSGAGDKVLRVQAAPPYLLHLEFQAGHDSAALPGLLQVRVHFIRFAALSACSACPAAYNKGANA